jgi:hypothetical protein
MKEIFGPIRNKVAESGLIVVEPESFLPQVQYADFDIAEFLFKGLILREKDFRQALKDFDWESIRNKVLLVYCTTDAIIPSWAFMLLSAKAYGIAQEVFAGSRKKYQAKYLTRAITELDVDQYKDQRVMIKGCGKNPIPDSAYVDLTAKLLSVVKSLFFGEPCSNVPIYKKKS